MTIIRNDPTNNIDILIGGSRDKAICLRPGDAFDGQINTINILVDYPPIEKIYVLVGNKDGRKDILAVKATMSDAKDADYKFSEFIDDTDIEEWEIGSEIVYEP